MTYNGVTGGGGGGENGIGVDEVASNSCIPKISLKIFSKYLHDLNTVTYIKMEDLNKCKN